MDLYAIQEKIRLGYTLSPSERFKMMTTTDELGRVSRRRFIGLKEYPESVIDFEE